MFFQQQGQVHVVQSVTHQHASAARSPHAYSAVPQQQPLLVGRPAAMQQLQSTDIGYVPVASQLPVESVTQMIQPQVNHELPRLLRTNGAQSPTGNIAQCSPTVRSKGVLPGTPNLSIVSSRGSQSQTALPSSEIVEVGSVPEIAGKPTADSHKFTRFRAATAYTGLLAVGAVRQAAIRAMPECLRDDETQRYATKEKFNPWLEEFFHQHMYRLGLDLFNRVIASAPEATVEVVKRTRPTPGRVRGKILEPLYDLALTNETRRCLNLASYNYLGFGGVDEYCTPAARRAAMEQGFNPGAPRAEGGTLPIHCELESEVASFLKKDDAIVLGMGFATNSTILPALLGGTGGNCKGILVLSDSLNHKSIVEGVRLSGGTVKAFPHNDMDALESELRIAATQGQPSGDAWRKVFILIEGIYSMEGEFCRLREIVTLKNRYKAYLYLDEAHSIGAVGATGRGVTELLGVPTSEVEVMMGTFTKSFGSAGGYIASSRAVIEGLRQSAPGSTFATAMSAPCAAQALTALRLIDGSIGGSTGAEKLAVITKNSNFFRQRLIDEGFTVLGDIDSPVIPVMVYHPIKLAKFSRGCLDRGIAIVVVGFPAVPVLEGRARFCISAAHTIEQLEVAAQQITEVGRQVGLLYERRGLRVMKDKLACGTTRRATRNAQQAREYAAWLRGAPMQRLGKGDFAPEVEHWSPEPLTPQVAPEILKQLGDLPQLALAAAQTPRAPNTLDLRAFDPLGYGTRLLPASSDAISAAMDVYGFGACGPRGFYGTSKLHLELEECIANFLGMEDAIMYSAGVATASSVLPALVQPGDQVIIDEEVHLGLRTGLRLCKDATISWIPHGDMTALESALAQASQDQYQKTKKQARLQRPGTRIFVVVEAIFQRTGAMIPLAEVISLKEQYGAYLILDETLSFGTLGATGRGLTEHLGIDSERVDALIGSFEHALAGVGGFCSGRKSIVEHQRLAGAGYCFSACCPPSACAGIMAMIEDLTKEGGQARKRNLQRNSALLHEKLQRIVAEIRAPLTLTGTDSSYVQHLRWTGAVDEGISCFTKVLQSCLEKNGVQVQLCAPQLAATETALNARIGARALLRPSIRLCTSSEQTEADINTVCAALGAALAEA